MSAKHGVVGLVRTLALELAPQFIWVNTVPHQREHRHDPERAHVPALSAGVENPTREQFAEACKALNALPIPWVEPADISDAVLFLASDQARYVTGVTFPVDAGVTVK